MWNLKSRYAEANFYQSLEKELMVLVEGEKNLVANLANISSWIFHSIPDLNWAGFYLWNDDDKELILGPFQGLPACLRIKSERGVCGKSFSTQTTIRVDDVLSFPGHIACDSASRSELVIPLKKDNRVYGVLDLDSPTIARFSAKDETSLEIIMNKMTNKIF